MSDENERNERGEKESEKNPEKEVKKRKKGERDFPAPYEFRLFFPSPLTPKSELWHKSLTHLSLEG
jgi:hypothetical protein